MKSAKEIFPTFRKSEGRSESPKGLDRFGSIRVRLTGIGLIFIMGTSLAMATVGIRLTTEFIQSRNHHNFQLLASYLARNAELGLLLEDSKMLESMTRNMLELEDIQEVVIANRTGRTLLHHRQKSSVGELITVSAPVRTQRFGRDIPFIEEQAPQELGTVTLTYSSAGLEQLTRHMIGRFLLVALLLATAPVILYWFIARAIVAPLQNLVALTRQVSHGHLDIRAEGGSLPETQTLASTFNEMLDALNKQRHELAEAHRQMAKQQALAELGKFSMMVAHEIKNPLAIIKGSLDILKKEELDPITKATMTGYLEEETHRINRLVEDFLLFARPDQPACYLVSLDDFLNSVMLRARLAQPWKEVKFIRQPLDKGLQLFCDPNLLERAILNILRNAVEAGANLIKLEAFPDGLKLILRITDNGPGIDEAAAHRIFDPFFSTKAKGSGLGLAMVKDIIEAHNGTITFETNADGPATTFRLELPLAESEPKPDIQLSGGDKD